MDDSMVIQRQHELVTMQQDEVVQRSRPSRILAGQLRIEQDGTAFYCLFVGGNPRADIASGIVGFGDTPEEATAAFDAAWVARVTGRYVYGASPRWQRAVMGWSIGYDGTWQRDIGYGVPAFCDHPRCKAEIDRGLAYVCGGEPYGGDKGCGLYFCGKHGGGFLCSRCRNRKRPFTAKPDHPDWMRHKLTDESWEQWRKENMAEVSAMGLALIEGSQEIPPPQEEQ